jgi:hypothetical protein
MPVTAGGNEFVIVDEMPDPVQLLEAYEAKRWPLGKEPGGSSA